MKSMILKAFLLPLALLALGSLNHASAATCAASYTLNQVAQSGFSCTTADGNLTFSNFNFVFQGGSTTGCPTSSCAPVVPDPNLDVTVDFAQVSSGSSDTFGSTASAANPIYTVITDYTDHATANEFQTEEGIVQYLVTDNTLNQTVTQVDAAVTGDAMSGADGTFTKNLCNTTQFGGGADPNGICHPGSDLQNAADISLGASSTQSDSTSLEWGSISDASLGVNDTWNLTGNNTNAAATATITSDENDFILTSTSSSTPEPGTFILLGGALVGIGALRRRKKVA